MDCDRQQRLIQLYVDQEIESEHLSELREHLRQCDACKNELREMVKLVSSLDSLKPKRKSRLGLHFPAVLAASIAAFFIIYMLPIFPVPGVDKLESKPRLSTVVLADESEVLPLPREDFSIMLSIEDYRSMSDKPMTTWIYPSAISSVLDNSHVLNGNRRYIFVSIPDSKTWESIMSTFSELSVVLDKKTTFPASIILNVDDNPDISIISFPSNKEGFNEWFSEMSSTSNNY